MLSHVNRFRQALNDTLLHRAEGSAFDRLCAAYGFPRPPIIMQEHWRDACISGVFSARGTPGPIFRFLESALGQWIEECSTFTCLALSRNLLEVPLAQSDVLSLQNRFCRIGDKLYRSSVLDGRELTFISANTTMFSAADFTPLSSYTVSFLPFDLVEQGAVYKVLIDSGIIGFPPTYLKADADEVRGTDEPFGGQLLDFDSTDNAERFGDPLGDGPHPIYLGTDDFPDVLGPAFQAMLVAGVRGVIESYKHVGGVSLYGSYRDREIYGVTSPEGPNLVEPTRG